MLGICFFTLGENTPRTPLQEGEKGVAPGFWRCWRRLFIEQEGKEVIIFTEGGQIKEMIGDSLRFKVKIDNAILSQIHKYLSKKPSEATR
jgi:hypothetical protein